MEVLPLPSQAAPPRASNDCVTGAPRHLDSTQGCSEEPRKGHRRAHPPRGPDSKGGGRGARHPGAQRRAGVPATGRAVTPSASRAVITQVPPSQERREPGGDDASRAQPHNSRGWEAVDEQEGAQEVERNPPLPPQQTTRPDRHGETTVSKPQVRSPPTPPSTQDHHHLRKALCEEDTAETGSISSRDVGSQPGKKPQKILRGPQAGTVDESPPVNAGDTGSSPGLGRSHLLQSHSARSLCSGAREPRVLRATLEGSILCNKRSPRNQKPGHHDDRLAAAPRDERKPQDSNTGLCCAQSLSRVRL